MGRSIGIYDHTTGNESGTLVAVFEPLVGTLPDITWDISAVGAANEGQIAKDFASRSVVVGHFDKDEHWEALIDASARGSIRIRTSTVGRSGHAHESREGVSILQLQVSHDPDKYGVTADEWRCIIVELQNAGVAERIVNGEPPASIVKFFGSGTLEILPALSILCQGYLIVHAKQGLGNDVPEYLRRASEQFPGLSTPVMKVEEHGFWNVFGGKNAKELADFVDTEWKGLAGNGDFGALTKLITAISSGDVITDVKTVAEAYKAIEEKLGASRVRQFSN